MRKPVSYTHLDVYKRQGDTVTLRISDGNTREVMIGAVTEHYTSHYMYIPEEKYSELFGDAPDYNIVYVKMCIRDSLRWAASPRSDKSIKI